MVHEKIKREKEKEKQISVLFVSSPPALAAKITVEYYFKNSIKNLKNVRDDWQRIIDQYINI